MSESAHERLGCPSNLQLTADKPACGLAARVCFIAGSAIWGALPLPALAGSEGEAILASSACLTASVWVTGAVDGLPGAAVAA